MLFLVLFRKVATQSSGGEVETDGRNGKQTKTGNLSADTDKTQSLTQVQLGLRIVFRGISPRDQYRGNQLQ